MEQNSFYLTLPSNVLSSPTNTLANYFTILPHRITVNGDWRVALTEISYTKSWYNIIEDEIFYCYNRQFIAFNGKDGKIVQLSKGYYEDEETLVSEINKKFQEFEFDKNPYLAYNKFTKKVKIVKGLNGEDEIFPYMSVALREILGFRNNLLSDKIYVYNEDKSRGKEGSEATIVEIAFNQNTENQVDISRGIRSLYVYSDIVHPVRVGDKQVQLLRTVEIPEKVSFGKQCVIKYDKPYYHPIITGDFNSIKIYIKDDAGKDIPFEFGRVTLTLHFQKWKDTI